MNNFQLRTCLRHRNKGAVANEFEPLTFPRRRTPFHSFALELTTTGRAPRRGKPGRGSFRNQARTSAFSKLNFHSAGSSVTDLVLVNEERRASLFSYCLLFRVPDCLPTCWLTSITRSYTENLSSRKFLENSQLKGIAAHEKHCTTSFCWLL